MSRYLAYPEIVFRDRELLPAALGELGFGQVEEGEDLPLFGYHGDRRVETAALVVRRQHIGSWSNDLGFARSSQGYYPIVSDYDRETLLGGTFLSRLRVTNPRSASAAYARCVCGDRLCSQRPTSWSSREAFRGIAPKPPGGSSDVLDRSQVAVVYVSPP